MAREGRRSGESRESKKGKGHSSPTALSILKGLTRIWSYLEGKEH
jgi:hypothetical protein